MTAPYFADRDVTIWHGNALALPLDDESVDLVCTSPPYFGLRSYTDAGQHYDGQIGSEATPAEFIDALIAATAEMVRVLKPSGSIWVNLGDKYAGTSTPGPQSQNSTMTGGRHKGVDNVLPRRLTPGVPSKSLMGLPWRYALRCIDDLGLILRAEVIWAKPNGLPESVTDRVRRSHEQWFHLVKQPRYYSAVDEVREAHADPRPYARRITGANGGGQHGPDTRGETGRMRRDVGDAEPRDPLGKLPGSVWTIPTQPLTVPPELDVDHFAAFPMEWPRRIITGWSPPGICTACGEGRTPIRRERLERGDNNPWSIDGSRTKSSVANPKYLLTDPVRIVGYACACDAPTSPTRPAVVLDPFGGTGTVALMARVLGRSSHHVDLSADYCRLARWRVTDPGERARAMQVDKPPPIPDGVDALFDLEAGA